MAGKGAAQGQYAIVITADADQAQTTVAKLAATTSAAGQTMGAAATPVTVLGRGLGETGERSAAAARELDQAENRARSLARTFATGGLNGSVSSLNSGLAGIATGGGPAAMAIGSVAIAAVVAGAAAKGAADAYAEQALALEAAAIAAGRVTPEITENANRARDYQQSNQELADSWAELTAALGESAIPLLIDLADGIRAVIENTTDWVEANRGLIDGLAQVWQNTTVLGWISKFGATQGEARETTAAQTRALQEQADALKEHTEAQADAARAAQTLARDALAADQADLRVQQVRDAWEQKQAEARRRRQEEIARAKEGVKAAEERLRDVEESSADRVVAAKERVRAAQERLRIDSLIDVRSARSIADAQRALARVQEDIGSGRLEGVDATRAYQDATEQLARAQEDQVYDERDRQQRIREDQRELAAARKAEKDAEVEAAAAIRKAQRDVRDAVREVRDAQKAAGVTALERRQHELDLRAAVLNQALAHRKLRDDVAEATENVANGTWEWATFRNVLTELHATQFPAIKDDLDSIKRKADAAARALFGHDSADSADRRAATGAGTSRVASGSVAAGVDTSGSVQVDVTVKGSATWAEVATHVHAELLKRQASGENLGFGGRR